MIRGTVFKDGISPGVDNELRVALSSGMSVLVGTGIAFLKGYCYINESSSVVLSVPVADTDLPRIDRVVIRLDRNLEKREIKTYIKAGTPSANPVPPELQKDTFIHELSLASYRVEPGATLPSNLVDERTDETVCGYLYATETSPGPISAQAMVKLNEIAGYGYAAKEYVDEQDSILSNNISTVNLELQGVNSELQEVASGVSNGCILKNTDDNYGGKFTTSGSDLNCGVTSFKAMIGGKYQKLIDPVTLNLNTRKASVVYAQQNPNGPTPNLGCYDAVYPEADSNTVLRYVFNEASGQVLDSSTNLNHGTVTGTVTRQVDGWADYGIKTDAGSIASSSAVNLSGAVEREMLVCFTPLRLTGTQTVAIMGSAVNKFFYIVLIGSRLYCGYNDTTNGETGYDLEIGKTYLVSYGYTGSEIIVRVNGNIIYRAVVTLATTASTINIGAGAGSFMGIFHYFEMRNKMRAAEQNAQISNKLCLPCHYTGYNGSYPTNDTTSGAHIYKFDDASGSTVTDENETLNGTATGTTIVDSEIGLGKARKFNGTSDNISLGNYAFPSEYSVIFVGNLTDYASIRHIFSNYNGTDGENLRIYDATETGLEGKLQLWNVNAVISSRGIVPTNLTIFLAVTVKAGTATLYINSPYPDISGPYTSFTTLQNLVLGKFGSLSTLFWKGTMDYFSLINKGLSQAEVAQYYNTLMVQKNRTLIDDCLPVNSISLGFARTDSTRLIEYNDTDYKYMRNEGATKIEGNKRVFLGWKYFSGGASLICDNPLGIKRINFHFSWAQDANGINETTLVQPSYWDGVTSKDYGLFYNASPKYSIRISTRVGGVCFFNGEWQTSGYIGCYAEVL
jgi:hypothetical protein